MLYAFFGTDTMGVRKEAFECLETLQKEGDEITKLTHTDYKEGMALELSQGVGLFGATQIIVIDTPSESETAEEDIFKNLETMQSSENRFILIDGKYDAAKKRKVTKHAEKVSEVVAGKKERFNVFSLTDALLRRDKKSLWLILMAAKKEGVSNEEIIGILFWQIKVMRLVLKTSSAEEAGQKSFVYQKTKKLVQNFKEEDVEKMSHSLVSIYHEGHQGKTDLDLALEHWVLGI